MNALVSPLASARAGATAPGERPPTPRAANDAWESLLRAQATLMGGFEAGGDFDPLSAREYDVLYHLSRSEQGRLPMRELVTGALVSQPSMSRLVDRLAAAGWVRREPDAHDGRAIVVVLTPRGRELQREVGRRHVRSITDRFAVLSEQEARVLRALCVRLIEHDAPGGGPATAAPAPDDPTTPAWEDAS